METTSNTIRVVSVSALVLTILGALNWLLVGLFDYNLVSAIFGGAPTVERIIYALVGISGLFLVYAARLFMPHVTPMTPRHPSAA